ncbi:MAG TPA: transcriptional regulator [Nitrososphaerales archaeon]|nr:transcriptional regulator [Nitrososphaerales archaeon]
MENQDRRKHDEAGVAPLRNIGGDEGGDFENLASLSASGPLSSSARVAILAALLAIKHTTFTELMLAVNLPKSSLNLSLEILKENKFVVVRRGFLPVGGPRTIIEITPEGERAIREHLMLLQSVARRLLPL